MKRVLASLREDKSNVWRIIDTEGEWRRRVTKQYGLRGGLPEVDIIDLLGEFQEIVEPYSFLNGQSSPLDIGLLKALARRYQHCRYLEIGTWRGESLANVAKVADECVSLDLSSEEIRERGWSEAFINTQRVFSKGIKNVQHIQHDSKTFDFSSLGKFDLVFVDGDHAYTNVESDTENAFRILRNAQSIIVWHDYCYSPETVRWEVLAGILGGCPKANLNCLYHVSNTLSAIYTQTNYPSNYQLFPRLPNKQFRVNVSATKLVSV